MIAQMAATAGSVAIGSTIGHGLSSMLFGGSSAANAEPAQQPAAQPIQQQNLGASCEVQAKGKREEYHVVGRHLISTESLKTLQSVSRLLMFRPAPGILSS